MGLRLLEQRDLEVVRRLRNANRERFFDAREIDAEQQQRWFETLDGGPSRFYVLEEDGVVVGTVSVTETPRGFEIGNVILDDAYRGRGLMRAAVEELTREPGVYFARIQPGNEPSLNLFAGAGFGDAKVVVEKRVGDA